MTPAQDRWFRSPKGRYAQHRQRAKQSGIPFLLTFEQWWQIWQESGHYENRGNGVSSYVMARPGDQGPYAIGNVEIITGGANLKAQRVNGKAFYKLDPSQRQQVFSLKGKATREQVAVMFNIHKSHVWRIWQELISLTDI